jgi:hypothetical protein
VVVGSVVVSSETSLLNVGVVFCAEFEVEFEFEPEATFDDDPALPEEPEVDPEVAVVLEVESGEDVTVTLGNEPLSDPSYASPVTSTF